MFLYELQLRYKVAVSTYKDDGVSCAKHAVSNHADGNVYIGFLFFWARDCVMTIGTLYLLVKNFVSRHDTTISRHAT